MHTNEAVMQTLGGIRDETETVDNLNWNLKQWEDNGFGLWMFYSKDTGEWVGRGGLRRVDVGGNPEVEVGYALMTKFWNQGFATEITEACLEIAFEVIRLENVVSFTLTTNKASQRVMEKCGFKYERNFIHADLPHVLYRIKNYRKTDLVKFTFKPLTPSDLNLLCEWLAKPHVLVWWNDHLSPIEIKEKYRKRIGDDVVCPYIAYLNNQPIAFIQYYWANKVGDGWWPNEDEHTVGLDQFIGEESYINKGYGTFMLKEFVQFLFQNPLIKKIITEADSNNLRAKRCYEKVGFLELGSIDTPDGESILMAIYKDDESLIINEALVKNLINTQFPQWKNLPIRSVSHQGWDNRTFHLGEDMLVRLPSRACYAAQVEKEQRWLPKLAPHLPLLIPAPLGMGKSQGNYLWPWSLYRYLPGKSIASTQIRDLNHLAVSLAEFLTVFEAIDTTGGPLAGTHSFYRGGSLKIYDDETRRAIITLKEKIDVNVVTKIWNTALASTWEKPPVWIHGDLSAGNLLVQNGQLNAVIDFGQLAIGDPACDLAIAWTLFEGKSRETFHNTLSIDDATWARGRGWALWKALITAASNTNPNNYETNHCWKIIDEIIIDYK